MALIKYYESHLLAEISVKDEPQLTEQTMETSTLCMQNLLYIKIQLLLTYMIYFLLN